MLLYVHGSPKGRGAQDGHLDFHTQFLSYETLLYVHGDHKDYYRDRPSPLSRCPK